MRGFKMATETSSRIQIYVESYVSEVKRRNPSMTPCLYIWQLREVGYSDKQIISLKNLGWVFLEPSQCEINDIEWWAEHFDKCIKIEGKIAYSLRKGSFVDPVHQEQLATEVGIQLEFDAMKEYLKGLAPRFLNKIHDLIHAESNSRQIP